MTDEPGGSGRQIIVFRVGARDLGLDIMAVREIRALSAPTPLPHVASHVRGVINLRGAMLPVIDLSERLGWGTAGDDARQVIVVVQIGARLQGLIVDSVSDIVRLDRDTLQPVPDAAGGESAAFLTGIAPVGERMVLVLDLGALALDPEPALAA